MFLAGIRFKKVRFDFTEEANNITIHKKKRQHVEEKARQCRGRLHCQKLE